MNIRITWNGFHWRNCWMERWHCYMRAAFLVGMTGNIRRNLICGTLTFSIWSSWFRWQQLIGRRRMRNTTPVFVITANDGSVTMQTEKETAGIHTPFRCDLLICGSVWMDLMVGCRKIRYFFWNWQTASAEKAGITSAGKPLSGKSQGSHAGSPVF